MGVLREALLSDTEFGGVRWIERGLEEAVQGLEEDLRYVRVNGEEIDLGGLEGRNVKREEIVERWSR